jgi:hypothetical protein
MGSRSGDGLLFLPLGVEYNNCAGGARKRNNTGCDFIVKGILEYCLPNLFGPQAFIVESNPAMEEADLDMVQLEALWRSVWHSNGGPLLSCGRLARSQVSPEGDPGAKDTQKSQDTVLLLPLLSCRCLSAA